MTRTTWMAMLVALVALAFCAPAGAQKMYKCGKQYQDRPCDDGQQGRVVGNATSGSSAKVDYDCSQRGGEAAKIAWAREGGATQDRALSEAASSTQRRLVQEVYSRRGSAQEIRSSIEADCMAEKEKAAKAAELARALMRAQGIEPGASSGIGAPSASGAPSGVGATSTGSGPIAQDSDAAARQQQAEADRKARLCASLNSQLESNTSRLRAGGSSSTMDSLNAQRRDLQGRLRDNGC